MMIFQLKDDGSLDEAALSPMIDGWFPEAAREPIKTGLKKCHEESCKLHFETEKWNELIEEW